MVAFSKASMLAHSKCQSFVAMQRAEKLMKRYLVLKAIPVAGGVTATWLRVTARSKCPMTGDTSALVHSDGKVKWDTRQHGLQVQSIHSLADSAVLLGVCTP